MNQHPLKKTKIILGITTCLIIAGITMSFVDTPFGPSDKIDALTDLQDTIPVLQKKDESKMDIKDFNLLLQKMDNEMLKLQKEAAKIDFSKVNQEIASSLDNVNLDKIKSEIDRAVKDVDFEKIEQGLKVALKEIDWNKINNSVKVSLQEAKKEIEKIDMESIKKQMEKAKIEIEKSKEEIKKIRIDEIMKDANAGIAKSKEELHLTKMMFNEMEKDGLIRQKDGFTIQYNNKTLVINGKKQTESVTNKYQQYIKGDSFKICIGKQKD